MRRNLMLIAALGAVMMIACHSDRGALDRAIRAYNDAIVNAYRTGDLAALRAAATQKEVHKVEALVDLKRANGVVLEAQIVDLSVSSMQHPEPDAAIVRTRETWRYRDRASRPGQAPGPRLVAKMAMEYECERHGGSWVVGRVRTLSNEFLEPKHSRVATAGHGEARD